MEKLNFSSYDLDIKKAPKANQFLTDLTNFIIELNKQKYQNWIKIGNYEKVENELEKKFQNLFIHNYALISALIKNEIDDLNMITKMINLMILVETKQIFKNEANEYMKELLNDLYVYSKFGGKENFEKTIKEKHKND